MAGDTNIMNSIPWPPEPPSVTGRILAIEPDETRAQTLREALSGYLAVETDIVASVADALAAIRGRVPDLVLTSVFLPPAEEAVLISVLRELPTAFHVQIITVPYFIDADAEGAHQAGNATVLDFFRRRSVLSRPRCSPREVCGQIQEYLRQSRELLMTVDAEGGRIAAAEPAFVSRSEDVLVPCASPVRATDAAPSERGDRRRAPRRRGDELPSIWSIRIPGTSSVEIIDISRRGVLIETRTKLAKGSSLDLEVVGQDLYAAVTARAVRSSVAAVDGLGVRYRVAAAFARDLDLVELQPASVPTVVPHELGDVLGRVLAEAERGASQAAVRARFEHELRRVLPVRDIQIRATPVIADRRTESIYFTVPNGSGTRTILQAVFEPGHQPSPLEFRLLKAAAGLAAVVLQFAPEPTDRKALPWAG